MIKLKDVSKYYYNKGLITSGITKINAEFNIGEFIVITGESGSGKSTLLNVISGLDTYEDGEMYIDGKETSHYGDETGKNDLLWAFTSWNTTSSAPISVYCWASYGFMQKDARLKKKDAHTFIHETGHMLGLEDYYDTGYSLSPFGGLGMMDYNILDLDVYSKWALGWIDPKTITNSTKLTNKGLTVTLKPFESSGDALVVGLPNNNGWYGEEYIILEYYTPT